MQPHEAAFALDLMLPMIEDEVRTTRKVLAAVPQEHAEFRPEPRIRSAIELAWHLASSEAWFLEGLINGQFASEEARMPKQMKTVADVLAYYERTMPPLVEQLRAMKPEELARETDFFGVDRRPAVAYLKELVVHSVHHRAQLALYLRLMGAKVPSIYGGSLDEPWQSAAEAEG